MDQDDLPFDMDDDPIPPDQNESTRSDISKLLDQLVDHPAERFRADAAIALRDHIDALGVNDIDQLIRAVVNELDLKVREIVDGTLKLALAHVHSQTKKTVDMLMEDLGSESVETRREAILRLQFFKEPIARATLVTTLENDPDVSMRCFAASGLVHFYGSTVNNAQMKALTQDTDASVCCHAAYALGLKPSTRNVEPLLNALNGSGQNANHPVIRKYLLYVLGEIEDLRVPDPLMNVMKNDQTAFVRRQAARALGMFPGQTSADALWETLTKDTDEMVCKVAAGALSERLHETSYRSVIEAVQNPALATSNRTCIMLLLAKYYQTSAVLKDAAVNPEEIKQTLLALSTQRQDIVLREMSVLMLGLIDELDAPNPGRELFEALRDGAAGSGAEPKRAGENSSGSL